MDSPVLGERGHRDPRTQGPECVRVVFAWCSDVAQKQTTFRQDSRPHSVGGVIFRWTENKRFETFTADPRDRGRSSLMRVPRVSR